MKNKYIWVFIIPLIAAAASCSTHSNFFEMSSENAAMHYPGESTGSDALSSSTNFSGKEQDTAPKLDPLSGAVYLRSPQIGNYGTVSLQYPVSVPGGRAGVQPSVGLSYSSSGGDGLAGIGWSLSTGLASISRTTSYGELWYDSRDTFAFNGKRLVKVSGSAGSEDGVYRCEIESDFSRFELRGSTAGGIWYVFDKSGSVTVLGETTDSRIYQPTNINKTYIWNFTRSFDLNGNSMNAVYDRSDYNENNVAYLSEIRYTGNTNAGTAPCQYVRFSYKDRDDAYVSKSAGFVMRMDRLIDTISVGWSDPRAFSDKELWSYTLEYMESEDSHRPLLKTVGSTRTTTKPEFIYQNAVHNFVWKMAANPWAGDSELDPKKTRFFEGDFNGDGISDMVFFNPETGDWKAAEGTRAGGYLFRTYANKFKGYADSSKIQFFKGNVTGDYNGDGRSDIAFYLSETRQFVIAAHDGNVLQFSVYGTLPSYVPNIFACEWFSGDYDGNGLSDSLLYYEPTGAWILMRNTGGSFAFTVVSSHFKNLYRGDYSPDSNLDSASTMDESVFGTAKDKVSFLCGDYNGDGRSDISVYDARSGKWMVGENYHDESAGFKIEWKLYKQFTVPEASLFAHDRFSGDFNGDGYSDFLLLDRSSGEWTLGSTEDGTIKFSTFSSLPSGMKGDSVTRWLQGDFNGDGRTDIGFYCALDKNFWVGEATPTGFRYRIYNNMSYGPDAKSVLGSAPLPADETEIAQGKSVVTNGTKIYDVGYQFNGNYHKDRGERAFAGSFSGSSLPEMLIYKGKQGEKRLYLQKGAETALTEIPNTLVDLDSASVTLLNHGRAGKFGGTGDSLVYCEKAATGAYDFYRVGSGEKLRFAALNSSAAFDPAKSIYAVGTFNPAEPALLVCDDLPASGPVVFQYYSASGKKTLTLAAGSIGETYFASIRSIRASVRLAVLKNGDIVLIDTTQFSPVWYKGTIDIHARTITFTAMSGSPLLAAEGTFDTFTYHAIDTGFIYSVTKNDGVTFHKVTINEFTVTDAVCTVPAAVFSGEYDTLDRPIVTKDAALKSVAISGSSFTLAACEVENVTFTRSDLLKETYPYTWIQGDYNGDGKTDIGIFHLKESKWYFASTTGTVPDMLSSVKNGIGGTYGFTYENSTKFDNTDEDGIARLPMNYKVCTAMTVDDGYGHNVTTTYDYAHGYAFSGFINGKKETDYFGFSEFTVTDELGAKTVSVYNTIPYDDYRKNRALAGAIKTSTTYGTDKKEYSRTEYDYTLHEVRESASQSPSWLIEPTKVVKYLQGIPVETREAHIEVTPNKYELTSRTESVTDHYGGGATLTSLSEFWNNETTNEMRVTVKKNFVGTPHEVRTDYNYDARGNLTIETSRYTGSGLSAAKDRITKYDYDDFGNRIRTTQAGENPVRIREQEYDTLLHQYVVKEIAVGELLLPTTYEINYESAFGAAQKKTDPNGGSVYYDYDGYGRLAAQRIDTDSGTEKLASYIYETPSSGWSPHPASGKVIQYTGDGFTKETRVYVDGLGRTLHSVWSVSEESGKRYAKSGLQTYDRTGRVIRKGQSLWADDSEIDSYVETTEKNPTLTDYDASGRVAKVTLPPAYDGEAPVYTTYFYGDPWDSIVTHSSGLIKHTVKNARGLVLLVEDQGTGDDGATVKAAIGFAYDIAGNRIKKEDLSSGFALTPGPSPSGRGADSNVDTSLFAPGKKDTSGRNIAQWKYDGFGQLVETSDPDLGYSRAVYNGFGEVISRIDAQNRTTVYSYDRLGRLAKKELPEAEGVVTYSYDTGGENALGKMTKLDDPAQSKTFDYDKIGRVKHENREIKNSSGVYETDFTYNLLNRTKSIRYPVDPTTKERITAVYSHCASGVSGIEITQGLQTKTIVKDVTYNEFGQMTGVTRGNDTLTSYTYDERGRLTHLLTLTADTGTVIQNVTYDFRIDNSIAAKEDNTGADELTRVTRYEYSYDGLNRLVGAKSRLQQGLNTETAKTFRHGYAYAANGNLMQKDIYDSQAAATDTDTISDRWSYTYVNHAVTGIRSSKSGTRFLMSYDTSGNMTAQEDRVKKVIKDIDFDSSNRITKVTNPTTGKTVGEYEYDDQGFRVRKLAAEIINGAETKVEVLYPSMYFAIERHKTSDGRDIPNTSYAVNNIYLNGVRVAASLPNGECQYYLTDQVDSVSLVTDDKASVVNRFEYLPFGEAWDTSGDGLNRPKYCSAELDAETNFYYMNARYQDPGICRFTTPDTVIDGEYSTQGWNRYSYCHNNPVRYKDPTGHGLWDMQWYRNEDSPGVKYNKYDQATSVDQKTQDRVSDQNRATESATLAGKLKKLNVSSPLEGLERKEQMESAKSSPAGIVTSGFGGRVSPITGNQENHPGIDLSASKGTKIKAAADGRISFHENNPEGGLDENGDKKRGYGYYAMIDHGEGMKTLYGHMNKADYLKNQEKFSKNDVVKKGDTIGGVGNSGGSTGNHLHFEIRVTSGKDDYMGKPIDPTATVKGALQ